MALDLGNAAVCSRYPESVGQAVPRIPFRLGACGNCGLIQLLDTPDIEWLKPPGQFAQFREPERHLDDLAAAIVRQVPRQDGLVMGLSYKDGPLVDRLRALGMARTVVLDRDKDWRLHSPRDGIETMQQTVTPEWARTIRDRHGTADILCVRHILEHVHNISVFLAGCRTLMAPGGWVLFETPGCDLEFARGDVGSLWEEHLMYFSSGSLRRGLSRNGFACRWVGSYPYSVDDCLAAFGQFVGASGPESASGNAGDAQLQEFQRARTRLRSRLQDCARQVAAQGRKIALWGAGHRTSTFVELLPATELVACIIDDDPAKQGKFLPGSGLPILSAEALTTQAIGLCVGLLNPDVMRKIAARQTEFAARGGRFLTLSDLAVAANVSSLLS